MSKGRTGKVLHGTRCITLIALTMLLTITEVTPSSKYLPVSSRSLMKRDSPSDSFKGVIVLGEIDDLPRKVVMERRANEVLAVVNLATIFIEVVVLVFRGVLKAIDCYREWKFNRGKNAELYLSKWGEQHAKELKYALDFFPDMSKSNFLREWGRTHDMLSQDPDSPYYLGDRQAGASAMSFLTLRSMYCDSDLRTSLFSIWKTSSRLRARRGMKALRSIGARMLALDWWEVISPLQFYKKRQSLQFVENFVHYWSGGSKYSIDDPARSSAVELALEKIQTPKIIVVIAQLGDHGIFDPATSPQDWMNEEAGSVLVELLSSLTDAIPTIANCAQFEVEAKEDCPMVMDRLKLFIIKGIIANAEENDGENGEMGYLSEEVIAKAIEAVNNDPVSRGIRTKCSSN